MTDWTVQSVIFYLNTARKLPEMRSNCPNTARELLPNPPENKSSWRGRETARTLP